MADGNCHSVHGAEDAATDFCEGLPELFDFPKSLAEKFVELRAECGIVGCDRGQDDGVIKGRIEPLLEFTHPRNDSQVHQSIKLSEAADFISERIATAAQMHTLLWQPPHIRL